MADRVEPSAGTILTSMGSASLQGQDAGHADMIDVQIRRPVKRLRLGFQVDVLLILLAGLFIMAELRQRGSRVLAPIVGAAVAIPLVLVLGWEYQRRRALVTDLTRRGAGGDLGALACSAVERANPFFANSIRAALERMARHLARNGVVDRTIRLWWDRQPAAIHPSADSFEPRLLDETDSALSELRVAWGMRPEATLYGTDRSIQAMHDVSAWGSIRRGVLLKGGWVLATAFGLVLVVSSMASYRKGALTEGVYIGALGLAISLAMPARTTRWPSTQWLIVPGGLVRRSARKSSSGCALYVFDRRRSVLCVCQRSVGTWWACVADGRDSDWTLLTTVEMEMLLHAWLSPVAPPSVERLADFR